MAYVVRVSLVLGALAMLGCSVTSEVFGDAGPNTTNSGGAGSAGAPPTGGNGADGGGGVGGEPMCDPSGDPGINPCDEVSGCVLWLRADLDVTLVGNGASTWKDQTDQLHDATQGNASSRPGFSEKGGPGCRPALRFVKANGSSMTLAGSWGNSDNHTIFAAVHQVSVQPIQMLLSTYGALEFGPAVLATDTQGDVGGFDRAEWRHAGQSMTGPQFLTWVWGDNELSCYRNGNMLMSTSHAGGLQFGPSTTLGKYRAGINQSNGHFIDALVSEVLVFDHVLDANDLGVIHDYMSTRYEL